MPGRSYMLDVQGARWSIAILVQSQECASSSHIQVRLSNDCVVWMLIDVFEDAGDSALFRKAYHA